MDFSDIDEVIIPDTTGQTAATIGAVYDNPITLQQVALDPTLEDAFLDQLTLNEMIELIADCGFHTAGVPRLGIPETQDNDGPACVKGEGGLLYSSCGVAWPAGTCLACTWNDVLAYQMGVCCGMEAVNVGTDIWYSPTANLHRNPCGGRNFEYYSEDPLLCGNMATQVALGAQSQGVIVTVKHLVLNEQETNRWGIITWAEEQTIREIYLRPFEQVIKEGKSIGVMSAYNRLGKTWCGANSVLLNELLRGEWGFDGYVITDFSVYKLTLSEYMSPVLAIYARNDCVLSGIWIVQKPAITSKLKEQYNADPVGFGIAMRECCRDLIHMKMKSLAFQTQIVTPSAIRVEGETATVTGKPNKGSTFVEATDAASQGYTLANLSKKGNVATWTVNAIEAGEYQLTMNLASTHLLGFDTQLADHITLSVNGQNLDLSGITIEGDGVLTFNVYHTYGPISAYLNAGTNTVVLTVIGSDVPNIDCMDFIKAE